MFCCTESFLAYKWCWFSIPFSQLWFCIGWCDNFFVKTLNFDPRVFFSQNRSNLEPLNKFWSLNEIPLGCLFINFQLIGSSNSWQSKEDSWCKPRPEVYSWPLNRKAKNIKNGSIRGFHSMIIFKGDQCLSWIDLIWLW